MTKTNITLSSCLLILVCCHVSVSGQTSSKKDTRNVLDYFNLAVQKVEDVKNYPRDRFRVKDLKNGFLEIANDDFYRQVALFRKDNGDALLVIAEHGGGPAGYTDSLEAYEIYEGKSDSRMVSVTRMVFPRLSGREELDLYNRKRPKDFEEADTWVGVLFELPRRGRIIAVKGNLDANEVVTLYELYLKNDRFIIVKK